MNSITNRHSFFGIASFVLSLPPVAVLSAGGIILFAVSMSRSSSSTATPSDNPPMAEMLASVLIAGFVFAVVAIFAAFWIPSACLGLVNLMQRDRKRVFGVLGLTLTGIAVAITVWLLVLALSTPNKPVPNSTSQSGP